jgi:cytochrome c553
MTAAPFERRFGDRFHLEKTAMNKWTLPALFAAAMALAVPVHAADIAAGKAKAGESCSDCHGDDGKGDKKFPGIAGMPVGKFTQAIADVQSGKSGKNKKMIKEAQQLSADDVANLAAYYASLKK